MYLPADAMDVFLEAFERPLDSLLHLIRRKNFNILDNALASVTRSRSGRTLLPPKKGADGGEPDDPYMSSPRRHGLTYAPLTKYLERTAGQLVVMQLGPYRAIHPRLKRDCPRQARTNRPTACRFCLRPGKR